MSMMGWREVFNAPAAALQKPEVEVSRRHFTLKRRNFGRSIFSS
jgi:hypothetical protein